MSAAQEYLDKLDSGKAPISKPNAEDKLVSAPKACRLAGDTKTIARKRLEVWWGHYGKGGSLPPRLSLALEQAYREERQSYATGDEWAATANNRERAWLNAAILVVRRDGGEGSQFWWNKDQAQQRAFSGIALGALLGEATKDFIADRTVVCDFAFDPTQPKIWDDGKQHIFNTYEPPEWRRSHYYSGAFLGEPVKKCPAIVLKFLSFLYDGDAESISYDLDWMASSLKGRTMCALGNVGECEGSGKGTNAELKARLHGVFGRTDWAVKSDVFTSKFNKFMSQKTFCCIQEIKIETDSQMNRFKELFDDEIAIEGKGEDATTERNHCSIMFTSNNLDCLTLPAGQRRFSILNVSGTKLTERMNGAELDAFRRELLCEKTISDLGKYLWETHIIRRELKTPFVGARAEEVRFATLKDWEQALLDWAENNPKGELSVSSMDLFIPEIKTMPAKPGRGKLEGLAKRFPDYIKIKKAEGAGGRFILSVRGGGGTKNVGSQTPNAKSAHQDAEKRLPSGVGEALGSTGEKWGAPPANRIQDALHLWRTGQLTRKPGEKLIVPPEILTELETQSVFGTTTKYENTNEMENDDE